MDCRPSRHKAVISGPGYSVVNADASASKEEVTSAVPSVGEEFN